jgi:MoxR-like ATPase
MAERQVTVDGKQHQLSNDFFVIATQNPHEQHGTYPLPEAQLDRFTMKLSVGYPAADYETAMLAASVKTESKQKSPFPQQFWLPVNLNRFKILSHRPV